MSYRDLPLRYYDAESLKNGTLGRFQGSIHKVPYSHYFRHCGRDMWFRRAGRPSLRELHLSFRTTSKPPAGNKI